MNMTEDKIEIRGVYFDNLSMDEALQAALEMIDEGGCHVIHTPNAEIVQLCVEKPEYYEVINSSDMTVPDGAGVILASKILKKPLKKGKVAGVELGEALASEASVRGLRLYMLGGKPGIAEEAKRRLCEKYPGLDICGCSDGYFTDDGPVIQKINDSGADILFVCLGVPKQELWMKKNRGVLNVSLMAGLGGSLDVYSGTVKRAPEIFIRLGLEWLYRLIREPRRIGRMMKLPKFVVGTIAASFRRKKA